MRIANILLFVLLILFSINCQKKKASEIPKSDADNGGQPLNDKSNAAIPKTDADNGGLFLPDGFGALVVAESVGPSRHLAVNNNGDIYVKLRVTTGDAGNLALRDTNNDGKADIVQRFGNYPNDGSFATEMRIHNGYLYF